MTGINFFVHELVTKRLGLLREFVPKAVRIAVLVNPGNAAAAEATFKEAREVAPALGMQILPFSASTIGEIEAAFAAIVRERADAVLMGGDSFLFSQRRLVVMLAMRDRLPTISAGSEFAQAGGLMAYGTSVPDMFPSIYVGSIVKGAKPADLPVLQSTNFEFVINLQTARALGLVARHRGFDGLILSHWRMGVVPGGRGSRCFGRRRADGELGRCVRG